VGNVIGFDDLLWDNIAQVMSNPDLIKQHLLKLDDEKPKQDLTQKIEMLNSRAESLHKQKDELLNLRMEGLLTAQELKRRLIKNRRKKQRHSCGNYRGNAKTFFSQQSNGF